MNFTWRRQTERFTIGDLEDCLYPSARMALLSRTALSHSDGLRRKTSIQLDSTQVSMLRSGKADGVSAQHTNRSLFEVTGTASRRSGPLMPNSSLDSERRILCQRTAAENISRMWISTKPAVLRPCVEPTWCWRGVRVANVSTPLVNQNKQWDPAVNSKRTVTETFESTRGATSTAHPSKQTKRWV